MILFIFKATPPELSRTEEAAKILVIDPRKTPEVLVQTFGHDIYRFNKKEMTDAIRAANRIKGGLEYTEEQKKRYKPSSHSKAYIAQDAALMEKKRTRKQTGTLTTNELAISELRVLMKTQQQTALRVKFDQVVNDIMHRKLFDPVIMSYEDIKNQYLTFQERLIANIKELENLEELINALIEARQSLRAYYYNPYFDQLIRLWENVKKNIAEKKKITKLYEDLYKDKEQVIYFPQQVPPRHPKKVVYLFHGMGSNETQFNELANRTELNDDILYVAFQAPLDFEYFIKIGYQWAKINSISKPDDDLVRKNIEDFLEKFVPFLKQLNTDIMKAFNLNAEQDLACLGFSQGAIIVLKLLLRIPVKNVIAISGAFDEKDPNITEAKDANILLIHDPKDKMVPYNRSTQAKRNLEKLGARVKLIHGAKKHELTTSDFVRVIEFLNSIIIH